MKVKLTRKFAKPPKYANDTDAGADLFSPVDVVVPARGKIFINLGICIKLPKGKAGFIYARSGLGSKHGIVPRNCVGVIDETYYQELGVMVENKSDESYEIKIGDRIAQLVVKSVEHPEIEVVSSFNTSGARDGGFGSSGK